MTVFWYGVALGAVMVSWGLLFWRVRQDDLADEQRRMRLTDRAECDAWLTRQESGFTPKTRRPVSAQWLIENRYERGGDEP